MPREPKTAFDTVSDQVLTGKNCLELHPPERRLFVRSVSINALRGRKTHEISDDRGHPRSLLRRLRPCDDGKRHLHAELTSLHFDRG